MPIAGLYKIFNHWHAEGTVWIYSDPHFNDSDLKAGINRPDADELVRRINAKCGRKDTFICLGDIVDVEYVRKIRAKYKILICGNHDRGASNYERKTFTMKFDADKFQKSEALEEMKRLYPNCRYDIQHGYSISHSPFEYWTVSADNMLFDEVYTGNLTIAENIILSHEPIENLPFWCVNLHGHDHTGRRSDKRHFNFCADVINYEPVNFNKFMKEGHLSKIESIHRETINTAIKRKAKRGGKKIGQQ